MVRGLVNHRVSKISLIKKITSSSSVLTVRISVLLKAEPETKAAMQIFYLPSDTRHQE